MKRLDSRGVAHHLLLAGIVVVGVAAIGYYVYQKSNADSFTPPAPVTLEFSASDWQTTNNSKVVTDPEQGQVLELTKTGQADDGITLASLNAAGTSKLAQLNTFEYNLFNSRKSTYYMRTCYSYKTVLSNQDVSKFPFVSTFQIQSSGGPSIGFLTDVYATGWTTSKCSMSTPSVQLKTRSLFSGNKLSAFTKYSSGVSLTGRTFLPDRSDLNPPAAGKAYIGKVTVTVSSTHLK